MTENLCRVVAFTSEAARSKVVEARMMKLFDANGSAKLSELQFLFNEYGKTAEYAGYWRDGAYLSYWRPLEKYDYRRYFVSEKGNKSYVAAVDAL
jgi:monoamine oxidase